jgi:hypothetical protein
MKVPPVPLNQLPYLNQPGQEAMGVLVRPEQRELLGAMGVGGESGQLRESMSTCNQAPQFRLLQRITLSCRDPQDNT